MNEISIKFTREFYSEKTDDLSRLQELSKHMKKKRSQNVQDLI